MDVASLDELLAAQAGLVSRAQVLTVGGDDRFVERQLRRRNWARVHRGVYVNHTGPLSWSQRCWAALLLYWPAALTADTALAAFGLRTGQELETIHVAVDVDRRVTSVPGIRVHRVTDVARLIHPSRTPPCLALEHAVLLAASSAPSDAHAIAILGDACQTWRTTAARLLAALDAWPRLPRRRFLRTVLHDVATGAYSVLEHRYLTRVERPHGLPTARRQRHVKPGRSSAYRDVEYFLWGMVVELDGRFGHEASLDRWADLDRDIDTAERGDRPTGLEARRSPVPHGSRRREAADGPRLAGARACVRPGLRCADVRRVVGMRCRELSAKHARR